MRIEKNKNTSINLGFRKFTLEDLKKIRKRILEEFKRAPTDDCKLEISIEDETGKTFFDDYEELKEFSTKRIRNIVIHCFVHKGEHKSIELKIKEFPQFLGFNTSINLHGEFPENTSRSIGNFIKANSKFMKIPVFFSYKILISMSFIYILLLLIRSQIRNNLESMPIIFNIISSSILLYMITCLLMNTFFSKYIFPIQIEESQHNRLILNLISSMTVIILGSIMTYFVNNWLGLLIN